MEDALSAATGPYAAPSVGDLVVALYDEARGISCLGLVLQSRDTQCKILWASQSAPVGWWLHQDLKKLSTFSEKIE
jgi:hypothetical protein